MNSTEESGSVPSVVEADVVSQNPSSNSQLVDEVFSLFKGYLTSQLGEKGKQFERSSKSDNEAADIKFKGNRKQFELNSQLDNILTQIDESASSPADVHKTSTYLYFVQSWVLLVGLPGHLTINLLYLFIYLFKRKIIYVRLSVAN